MKILLTGSGGMVGRNILEHPLSIDHQILKPSRTQLDLLNPEQISLYLEKNQPDLIIHAAGVVGGIQANIAEPVKFLVENLNIGSNLIMSARNAGIKKLLNLSSSCMYPRNATNPLQETFILGGELEPTNEGYALAKIAATRLCEYINREDKSFIYKTIIPCNLYGRYDKFSPQHSHMIPAVIKKLYDAKNNGLTQIDIWGDGQARREFMYAGDLADFIYFAIPRIASMPQNINVGLGFDYSINEYYELIAEVTEYRGKFVNDLSKPVGMKRKLIDDTQLSKFGWKAKTSLKEGLEETFKYYKQIVS
jgi:GDP-L-fucose synthase